MANTRKQEAQMDVFKHAIEALELEEVLGHIASKCVNDGAKQSIRSLQPTTDRATIASRYNKIQDICDYQSDHGRLPMVDTSVKALFSDERGRRDVIPPEGLLSIAAIERAVIDLQRVFRKDDDRYGEIRAVVARMNAHKEWVESIDRCLENDGSIKDKASRALADIRKSITRTKSDIRRHADKLAKSFGSAVYATFTGNRYILLVPREKCRHKDGIVHSTSHSGGSLYYEPLSLVERNNTLETLLVDERAEEGRIIGELSSSAFAVADELHDNMDLWEALDVLNAIGDFSREFSCSLPKASAEGNIRLGQARHPLLERSLRTAGRAESLIPLDLTLDAGARVMVITGPNAGGKTVTLKTVGLLIVMFQCGLPVPCAEGTELAVFDHVFADLGDEQSIASSLSTFTSHLQHLDLMCETAGESSLCLVDEIGDGTDPDEGSALAVATLEHLLERGAAVIATTHYGKVKTFALNADGVENASMVFDDDSGEPLYRLLQGMAGRSRGLETAKRLDFFASVIERAQSMLGKNSFRLETLLSELESTRLALEDERRTLSARSSELQRLVESYDMKEREIRDHKSEHKARAKKEAEEILRRTRKEIEAIVKEIRESAAAKPVVKNAHARLESLFDATRSGDELQTESFEQVSTVAVGDRVSLNPNGEPSGIVVSIKKDTVSVEIRGKKINAKKSSLYRARGEASEVEHVGVDVSVEPLEATNIDVRGKDREQALAEVDLFLDRAVLNGVHEVTVIHGVGEEILLDAIQSHLKTDSRVQSLRTGGLGEGGRGVSVVRLK